jgi:hypothetical protein
MLLLLDRLRQRVRDLFSIDTKNMNCIENLWRLRARTRGDFEQRWFEVMADGTLVSVPMF